MDPWWWLRPGRDPKGENRKVALQAASLLSSWYKSRSRLTLGDEHLKPIGS
jgi:hypothetical protein